VCEADFSDFFRDYYDLKRQCLNMRSRSVAGSKDA
jgi:hypothetical protein